jgi:hypothetical protein
MTRNIAFGPLGTQRSVHFASLSIPGSMRAAKRLLSVALIGRH